MESFNNSIEHAVYGKDGISIIQATQPDFCSYSSSPPRAHLGTGSSPSAVGKVPRFTDRGCFLANFKPERGDYAVDGALYTMEAKSFKPNDYGLYNMAGNVSEWTNTAYNPSSYYLGSTMNPNVDDDSNQRKVIRGGSWKDVAYFLEVAT